MGLQECLTNLFKCQMTTSRQQAWPHLAAIYMPENNGIRHASAST